jgi:hypothetical protein
VDLARAETAYSPHDFRQDAASTVSPQFQTREAGPNGISLIELRVAVAVAALAALAIFGLFRAGVALQQRGKQTIAAGDAALGLDVIIRAVREAARGSGAIRLFPRSSGTEHAAVAVRTARSQIAAFAVGDEGQPEWTGWIGFVFDPSEQVVRLVEFPGLEEPPAPPWEGGRSVIRQVSKFVLLREADRLVISLLIAARDSTMTLETVVWPRNR